MCPAGISKEITDTASSIPDTNNEMDIYKGHKLKDEAEKLHGKAYSLPLPLEASEPHHFFDIHVSILVRQWDYKLVTVRF
jgi:hypothetical protein